MNTLIIYANYKEHSFSALTRDTLAKIFHENNHQVVVRDLYEIKFNPVLSKSDLESIDKDIYPVDIMREQKFITWADLICFVYPIWWSGMPAILKGYIERVFGEKFAFEYVDGKPKPLLEGKNIMLFNTTGSKRVFENQIFKNALNIITEDCIFKFCGMNIIEHKYFEAVSKVSEEKRKEYLNQVISIAQKV
jgi:NAD(P)H dehydrogenase (quinone)